MNDLLLSYYGDDFTGSTDVMEALSINGIPTVLFLQSPTLEDIRTRFPHVKAVGIAGVSRSMTPAQMDAALPEKFQALEALNTPITHYKVCSTFDSSPQLGSIGHAIDLAAPIFTPEVIPMVVGVPQLKRYVVFGNLFASVQGETYRLDRHPTMSKHPATPMHESDLRRHLSAQTSRSTALIDVHALAASNKNIIERLHTMMSDDAPIVLFDTLDSTHLAIVGDVLATMSAEQHLFIVGSSGVEYALAEAWQRQGIVQPLHNQKKPSPVDQLVVMSGSASPVNQRQIEVTIARGAVGQRINTARLVDPATVEEERETIIQQALKHLAAGQSLVLYTALGPDDPAIGETLTQLKRLGLSSTQTSEILGRQQGLILNALIEKMELRRVCVAGGDTSGHTAAAMGIDALEFVASIAPGAPLCRASSHIRANDGLEIAFKGGQNGGDNYFELLQRGGNM